MKTSKELRRVYGVTTAPIERAAAHGIKLKVSKRGRLERQTVIDPIPALFVCVLPDAKAGVLADYQVITGWRLSPNTESGGSSRSLLYDRALNF
jgi:hypothetical protein